MSIHSKSYRQITGPAIAFCLCAALSAPTYAAPPPPPNATPLQQNVFNGVVNMCLNFLDNIIFDNAPQNDLHDQCHAIAESALNSGGLGNAPASALGALQQVSGNQVTAQGSLATRVSSGQFANISGRINALRFGSAVSIGQGTVARSDSTPVGPQSFYLDSSVLDRSAQNRESSQDVTSLRPLDSGSFLNTAYVSDLSFRQYGDGASGSGSAFSGAAQVPNPWGLFVQGSYNSGKHDATEAEDPFDFHSASITAGMDYNFGMGVLGASIGYDDYDAGFGTEGDNVSGGSARVQGTSASVYGAWFGQNWTFNGIASYGRLITNLTRHVSYDITYIKGLLDPQTGIINDNCPGGVCNVAVNRTLTGNPDGRSLAVGATAGYQYSVNSFDLLPSLSVAYRRASVDAFSEVDAADPGDGLPLAFNDQNVDSLRSILGVDISRPVSVPFGVVTPLLRVEWDHEYMTGARTIEAHYVYDPSLAQGMCASCFDIPTNETPANYGVAGLGVSVTLAHRVQAFVYDELLVGYTDYHSNTVSIGLRGQF